MLPYVLKKQKPLEKNVFLFESRRQKVQPLEVTLQFKAEKEKDRCRFDYLTDNRDFFIYNGGIDLFSDKKIINLLKDKCTSENIVFFLTTPGGDPDAAYRLSRYLQQNYKTFTLAVLGECKSAGTLLALGASEIIMNSEGEFGPLDVQLFRPDEFMQRTSGLTISQSLSFIGNKAFETFEKMFLDIRGKSGGVITTSTAASIASSIVSGIYSPITEKIDPMRIGEMQRSMDIAIHYGIRLGADEKIVQHLAKNYPSHSFVIDFEEAQGLFKNVRLPNEAEELLIKHLDIVLRNELKFSPFSSNARTATACVVKLEELGKESKLKGVADDSQTQCENHKTTKGNGNDAPVRESKNESARKKAIPKSTKKTKLSRQPSDN